MEWNGKKVLVIGMARSGIAAAELLMAKGATPMLSDTKGLDAFGTALDALKAGSAAFHLGEDPVALVEKADAVVISPGVPIDAAPVVKAKQLGVPLIGELELGYLFDPSQMVALTGTNGKTTTVSLLCEIFKNAGKIARTAGNIGYPYTKAAAEAKAEDVTVVEVSSFQLETVDTFHPKVAAILNISEDHLNRHGTMEAYTKLKMRIFENQDESDYAVLNLDDPVLAGFGEQLKSKVMYFSRFKPVTLGAYVKEGMLVSVFDGEEKNVVSVDEIRIPGPHNLENALAATCMATAMGVPTPVIRHSLRTFQGVEHRIEFVRTLDGITYINDSKGTNVDSTIKAVQTMQDKTAIILGGYDKHTDFVPLAKEIMLNKAIQAAVLLGETKQQINLALDGVGYQPIVMAETLEDAIQKAREQMGEHGNVLLSPACASFDMFKDYEERGRVFKEIVNNLS